VQREYAAPATSQACSSRIAASAIVGAALLTDVTNLSAPFLAYAWLPALSTDGSASHLIDDLDYQTVDTAVVARKLPKQGPMQRCINVVRIQVIAD